MTPEGKQKAKVKKILDDLGCYYFFPAANGYGRSSIPDIIVCMDGLFLGLEIKAGKNKATALQLRELDRIRQHGGLGLVVDDNNIDTLEHVLQHWRSKEWTL